MFPVKVVELYLHKVPMILVVLRQQVVVEFHVAMERESKIAYASCLPFFHKEIENAVVHVSVVELHH